MNKNHLSDPDILLLKCPQNAGNSIFQSIRNQTFSKQCMLPDTLEVKTPSLKKILEPTLRTALFFNKIRAPVWALTSLCFKASA